MTCGHRYTAVAVIYTVLIRYEYNDNDADDGNKDELSVIYFIF